MESKGDTFWESNTSGKSAEHTSSRLKDVPLGGYRTYFLEMKGHASLESTGHNSGSLKNVLLVN